MALRYNIKNNKNIKTSLFFNPGKGNHLDDIQSLMEYDDTVNVHTTLSDDSSKLYKNIMAYINQIITNSEFLCKGLSPSYILNSFYKADAVVVIGSSMNVLPNGNVYGFALLKFDEPHNAIYIDIICSHVGIRGAGDFLLTAIERMSRKLLMTKVYLNSVDTAIAFYEKYGFVKTDKLCDDMCLMIKSTKRSSASSSSKKKSSSASSKKKSSSSSSKKKSSSASSRKTRKMSRTY